MQPRLTGEGTVTHPHRQPCWGGGLLLATLGAYLEDHAGRLGVVPQRDAEEAEEGRLGLVGLGTPGADHAGP